jgi:hypothetical protein
MPLRVAPCQLRHHLGLLLLSLLPVPSQICKRLLTRPLLCIRRRLVLLQLQGLRTVSRWHAALLWPRVALLQPLPGWCTLLLLLPRLPLLLLWLRRRRLLLREALRVAIIVITVPQLDPVLVISLGGASSAF